MTRSGGLCLYDMQFEAICLGLHPCNWLFVMIWSAAIFALGKSSYWIAVSCLTTSDVACSFNFALADVVCSLQFAVPGVSCGFHFAIEAVFR